MSAEFTDDYDALYEDVVVPPTVDREKLPDGDYNAEIVAAQEKAWPDGTKYFEVAFRVTDGPHANRRAWMNMQHGSEKQRIHTMAQVHVLGMQKVSEFARAMAGLEKTPVNINVWQNGKYTNVKINKRMDSQPAPVVTPAVQPALPGVPAATTPFD